VQSQLQEIDMKERINVAQIGCGYWGPNLVRNFSKIRQIDRLVVCDTSHEMLEKIAAEFPSIETSQDAEMVINDPAVDAVIIALPAFMHYEYAKKALMANKHVMIEKPIAKSSQEAEELIRIGKEKDRVVMTGHTFLYNSAVRRIKQYIEDGELGDIYYIFSQRLNLGRVRQDVNAMWNLAPHDISIILYWLNENPSSTFAKGVSFLQEGVEDLVFMHLDFPSGKSAHIHVSWLDPNKSRKMIVVGSKKMLIFDDVSPDAKISIYNKGIDKTLKNNLKHEVYDYASFQMKTRIGDVLIPKIDFDEPLKIECNHFVECIKTGTPPLTGGEDGLRVVQVLEEAQSCLDRAEK